MGNIVVSENMTIDGAIHDPGWFDRLDGADRGAWAKVEFDEAQGSAALLLGRLTYEWFVERGWPSRTGEWADRLRSLPKYVVSSTLRQLDWSNSTVLASDEIATLKGKVDGDIVVYGSGRLVRTLLAHDLVDELRLMICPFVLGAGERLFGETCRVRPMRLVRSSTVGDGLALLTYEPAGTAGP